MFELLVDTPLTRRINVMLQKHSVQFSILEFCLYLFYVFEKQASNRAGFSVFHLNCYIVFLLLYSCLKSCLIMEKVIFIIIMVNNEINYLSMALE